MALAVTHATSADGTFSAAGDTAWEEAHTLTGEASVAQGGTGASTAVAAFNTLATMDGLPDADDTANGPRTATWNAGETVAQWEAVYFKSDGKWWLTDADAAATAGGFIALALEAKSADQAMSVALPGAFCRNDAWNWTVGGAIYLSGTAGALTQTQPAGTDDVVRVVGFATSADTLVWLPSSDYATVV